MILAKAGQMPDQNSLCVANVSVIVNFHREGEIANKTLDGIRRLRLYAERFGIQVQLICVLDNADAVTQQSVLHHSALEDRDIVFHTHFGDPGLARNHAFERASGEFACNFDGDDFFSENWIVAALDRLRSCECDVMVHPAFVAKFGTETSITALVDQTDGTYPTAALINTNPWIANSFGRTALFRKVPYESARREEGFGYEDWHWNLKVIVAGIVRVTAPNTVMFYRRQQKSRLSEDLSNHVVIRPAEMFESLLVEPSLRRGPRTAERNSRLLQDWAMWGLSVLSISSQARWLTTLYIAHEVFVKRHTYPFAVDKARARRGWRTWIPGRGYEFLCMAAYCLQMHRRELVIDGLLRRVMSYRGVEEQVSSNPTKPIEIQGTKPAIFVPEWIQDEMRAIATIEPILAPTQERLASYYVYQTVGDPTVGLIYAELHASIPAVKFDVVLVGPWVKCGGADKGIIQFLEHYRSEFGQVLCITTYDADSPWLNRIPDGVTVLEAGRVLSSLGMQDRRLVLARLLLQAAPRIVHVVNSEVGWEVLAAHGKALRSLGTRLVASLFGDELDANGRVAGYGVRYASECRAVLDYVITDNCFYSRLLQNKYGYEPGKVGPIYFWHSPLVCETFAGSASSRQFLWAGRICEQKNPGLLLAIAAQMRGIVIDVWGEVDPRSARWAKKLAKAPNIRLRGSYENFAHIVASGSYRGFLYTSRFDGLPNVLLEAIASGLPVVAPVRVGGIGELITEKTGYPVYETETVDQYADAMTQILLSPTEAATRAQAAVKLVAEQHSKSSFDRAMSELIRQRLKMVDA